MFFQVFRCLSMVSPLHIILQDQRSSLCVKWVMVFTAISYSDRIQMRNGARVIIDFKGKIAKDIWETNSSKTLPRDLWIRAKALLTIMHATRDIEDLKIKGQPPNIRLHKLKVDRKVYWSVTIKLPWCITFRFKSGEYTEVKIENYH